MDTTVKTQPARTPFLKRLALATAALTALAVTPALLVTPAHAGKAGKNSGAAAPAAAASAIDDDVAASGVVNLNTASEEELQLLPGVGPSKAALIIAYRKKYGAFKKVEDLNKVKGFGFKTLKKLKPYLAISGATTLKGKSKKTGTHGDEAAGASASAAP